MMIGFEKSIRNFSDTEYRGLNCGRGGLPYNREARSVLPVPMPPT
jgi:hypothetical protein